MWPQTLPLFTVLWFFGTTSSPGTKERGYGQWLRTTLRLFAHLLQFLLWRLPSQVKGQSQCHIWKDLTRTKVNEQLLCDCRHLDGRDTALRIHQNCDFQPDTTRYAVNTYTDIMLTLVYADWCKSVFYFCKSVFYFSSIGDGLMARFDSKASNHEHRNACTHGMWHIWLRFRVSRFALWG